MSKKVELGRKSAYTANPRELTIIGRDTKHKRGEHPLWDERAAREVDEAMVCNIMVYGVIEPVTVVRDGDGFNVVDGRGRVMAAREANKRLKKQGSKELRIPVLMRDGDDSRLFGVMVSANEHRRADDVLVKAQKAGRMLDFDATEEEVANAFGVTVATVRGWKLLLSASPRVQKAITAGAISSTAATALARLPRDKQDEQLSKLTKNGQKPTVRDAEKAAVNGNGKASKAAPSRAMLRKLAAHPKLSEEVRAAFAWAHLVIEGILGKIQTGLDAWRSLNTTLFGDDFPEGDARRLGEWEDQILGTQQFANDTLGQMERDQQGFLQNSQRFWDQYGEDIKAGWNTTWSTMKTISETALNIQSTLLSGALRIWEFAWGNWGDDGLGVRDE